MKNHVKNFGRFINEGRQRHTRFEAQVDIEMGLGSSLADTADFFAYLAKIAPTAVIMEIEVEDSDLNPNAGAILTVAGDNYEIGKLEEFNKEMEGDLGRGLDRRFFLEDHPEDEGGSITRPPYMGEE